MAIRAHSRRWAKKGSPVYKIEDLIPDRHLLERKAPDKQDPETIKALLIGALSPTTEPRKRKKHAWGKRKRREKKEG